MRRGSDEAAGILPFVTYLAFQSSVYQNTYRTDMGSLVSVTIANLVMEDVKERAMGTTHIPFRFWKWYVDDTCTCTALLVSKLQEFLSHLNGVKPSIQFTVETESEGKLPFLDVLLQCDLDGSILMTVYTKSTHTDRYLASHPITHSPQDRSCPNTPQQSGSHQFFSASQGQGDQTSQTGPHL